MTDPEAQNNMDYISQSKSKKDVAQVLLQKLDPLREQIFSLIGTMLDDYVIAMRRQLLSGDEFLTVRNAARKVGVSVATIYVWIDKGILSRIYIEGKLYVSISELRFARQSIYQPAKATKKLAEKQAPSESKPLPPRIEVRDGLPYFPDLQGEGKKDSVESL